VGKERQSCSFLEKKPWWKKKHEMVCNHDTTASSFVVKVLDKVFTHFHTVAVKWQSSMGNRLFGQPGWILREQLPWCQIKWWECSSWLCSSPVSPFLVSVSLNFPCTTHDFFPACLSNHCQGLHHTFSEICAKCDAHALSDPSQSHIRPDTWLQIKGHKDHHVHPAAWNFVHWLPRYASIIIYHCVELLQPLYRWQHKYRKLWLPPRKIKSLENLSLDKQSSFRTINFIFIHGNVNKLKSIYKKRLCL
jgi:hypothetical protein